jgi:hypothetical protein
MAAEGTGKARVRTGAGHERIVDGSPFTQSVPQLRLLLRVPGPQQPAAEAVPAGRHLPCLQRDRRRMHRRVCFSEGAKLGHEDRPSREAVDFEVLHVLWQRQVTAGIGVEVDEVGR